MKKIFFTLASVAALAGTMNAATIYQRRVEQQDRIGQGVYSGQLTPRETSYLEHREAGINREIRNEKAWNGGYLTPGERGRIQHQQNVVSNQIYHLKHNGARW